MGVTLPNQIIVVFYETNIYYGNNRYNMYYFIGTIFNNTIQNQTITQKSFSSIYYIQTVNKVGNERDIIHQFIIYFTSAI